MSARSITVAGGDLFAIAAQEYGDALLWTRIAAANKLYDPLILGVATLTIPPPSTDTAAASGLIDGFSPVIVPVAPTPTRAATSGQSAASSAITDDDGAIITDDGFVTVLV